mgnify:CR=1 FL=1
MENSNRPRRMRKDEFSRRLMREHHLRTDDLIYPVFVMEGHQKEEAIPSMPGIKRQSADLIIDTAKECFKLGIPAIALFPVIDVNLKTEDAKEAYNPKGLIPRVVALLKQHVPQLGVITDVALDPYTSHGQDGLIDASGYVLNDETVEVLIKQALSHAKAGADIVAPSDMMDGRIGYLRDELDNNGFENTGIMAYTAKYARAFYGPFRDALNSAPKKGDKKTYQMDFRNTREALLEAELDYNEGADFLMVKPALHYMDVIKSLKDSFNIPIAAYHVSGECAMLSAACKNGWLDFNKAMPETLFSLRRAGADIILTYFAKDYAKMASKL